MRARVAAGNAEAHARFLHLGGKLEIGVVIVIVGARHIQDAGEDDGNVLGLQVEQLLVLLGVDLDRIIVASFDDTAALAVPGVEMVRQIPSGIAVYATGTYAAMKGREALVIKWDDSAAELRSSAEGPEPERWRSPHVANA